jgi:hypothetical protein
MNHDNLISRRREEEEPSRALIGRSMSFSADMGRRRTQGKYPLLVDPVIRESRVKKVLVDGGSSINVTFPRTLQGLGVHLKELHESDTPFFGIVPTEGEYPLGHIYMPVTFGTPENYRTEFLRFEVANFNCGYNAIIGRPGLAKFMAIPHYTYMILKMPGPQGIITVRATSKAPLSVSEWPSK